MNVPGTSDGVGREGAVAGVLARSRAYDVLSRLVARGVTPDIREEAVASPPIAEALRSYADDDAVAADHHHVLGFCVPPIESVFLEPTATAGGRVSESVHAFYHEIGFTPDPGAEGPDHLATELDALAFLGRLEADALGADAGAEVARAEQRAFLDLHLLRWLPVFEAAVRRVGRPIPAAVVRQVAELVRLHRTTLGEPVVDGPFELEPAPALLDAEDTGLGEIATILALPAKSGVFLSREDLARLGRSTGVPRGFGDRRVLLENLLRAAVQHDALEATVDGLLAVVAESSEALSAWGASGVPGVASLVEPWRRRAAETASMLARMRQEAERLTREPAR